MARLGLADYVGKTFEVKDLPPGENTYTGLGMVEGTLIARRHDLTWNSVFDLRSLRRIRPESVRVAR